MLFPVLLGITIFAFQGCKKKGCTDSTATNYDPEATKDDGSCQYAAAPIKGCMDPTASNYDPKATVEDNSTCTYAASSSELLSFKVSSSAPAIDGSIDAVWSNVQKLTTTVTVPDPGGNYFKGYVGNSYNVTLRSMYDANTIYFLAEWNDPTESLNRQTWYFDPTSKRWKQESNKPTFDAGGTKTREAFYEDKFAMLWNVNNSSTTFNSSGCYASCHTGLDAATHHGPALHYTNGATERIDMWHWKSVRTDPNNQWDDQYQNDEEFGSEGGRKSDPKTSGGYSDNKQTLVITGDTISVSVPKYVIPNKTNYYWILQSEIDGGTAKLVTAVDANGVLTYSGGAIDPTGNTDYQRVGASTGSKCFPSIVTTAFVGDRGDITAKGVYTGSGWVLEFKRALTATNSQTGGCDVQFSTGSTYTFGIGVFENAAIAHAIKPSLTLKFKP